MTAGGAAAGGGAASLFLEGLWCYLSVCLQYQHNVLSCWPRDADLGTSRPAKQSSTALSAKEQNLRLRFDLHQTYSLFRSTQPPTLGGSWLVTFRLRFDSHRGSFASNLEQVSNLQRAQVNSASYPQRDGKWVVAYGLWGEGLVWLIGAVVCLLAANRWSNCSLTQAMDGRIVRCGIISSCQSAVATSEIVKRFWSRVWLM